MKILKKILPIFLLFGLPTWTFCQPGFIVTETNLSQTVTQIQQIYGSQINLSNADIYNFLHPFVLSTVPEADCPPPSPQIDQLNAGTILFSWPSLASSVSYGTFYLNLDDGSNASGSTVAPNVGYTGLQELNLFGFQSVCGGGTRGPVYIIIVDVDIFFPAPNEDCECELSTTEILYDGSEELNSVYIYPWSDEGDPVKYRLRVDGVGGYHSEVSFVHQPDDGEFKIALMPTCDDNANSSASPLRVGSVYEGEPVYNVTFYTTQSVIYVPAHDLSLNSVLLDVCQKKGKSKGLSFQPKRVKETSGQLKAFPNPGSDFTQLEYELSEDSEVQISVYDLLGRVVEEVLPSSQQTKGSYQLSIDLSHWPSGIYSCELLTTHHRAILLLQKE